MSYRDFKDLIRGTGADKVLHDKLFTITKMSNFNGYQCRLASMIYKFFDKNSAGMVAGSSDITGIVSKAIPENHQLAKELHKPIIRKFK